MTTRTTAPSTQQVTTLKLAIPKITETASGISIYQIDEIPEDVLKITFQFAAGRIHQPQSLVAGFTTDLLLSGTATKSQLEIQETIDFYGGYVQAEMGLEQSSLTIYCLKNNIIPIYKCVYDALINAQFPEKEFEQHRKIELQRFQVNQEKTSVLTRKRFANKLFGGTPFDSTTEEVDYKLITREDCISFHQTHFLKGLIDISIVGNLENDFIEQLKADFNSWKNGQPIELKVQLKPEIGQFEEKKDGAIQAAIRIGKELFTPTHPDYIEFDVLNTLLGGYFGSRLMSNIREDKGYTYGIGSGVASMKSLGYFYISTEVGIDVKEATIHEIKFEIERLQNELVSDEELDLVRNYMIGQLLKSTDGPFAMMNQFMFLNTYQLDKQYFNQYIKTILNITPDRIQQLAKHYLQWDSLIKVSVG